MTSASLRRIAVVLWSAEIGGAETVALSLARRWHKLGARTEFVIIGSEGPLLRRLDAANVRYRTLDLERGRSVLRSPRRYAEAVKQSGPDGAVLPECSFLGAALRLGGYDRPIVAVEHGAVLFPAKTLAGRMLHVINRRSGAWANDAEVGVSDYVLSHMLRQPHARRLRRIYNGVDTEALDPVSAAGRSVPDDRLTVGFVGRLVPGKGADFLIRAIVRVRDALNIELLVAGGGPERARLSALADELNGQKAVRFLGAVDDVSSFWRRCDIAIVPSAEWIESFCMAALEAMAAGKPVVATRNGALPELILDGQTGTLVPPGDVAALTSAIISYGESPGLRHKHGAAARLRVARQFGIDDCARAYLDLFSEIDLTVQRRWAGSLRNPAG